MDKKTNNSNDLEFVNDEKEQDFYRDLDKKTSHRSCCTWQTLILFFVGVLLILSGAIFFIYWQVSRGGSINFAGKPLLGNIENKIKNSNPDVQGQYNITITADELNSILTEGLSVQDFVLRDATASINPKSILIYGNLIEPLNSKIVLEVVPKAENNKLVFKISKITAGNIVLPTMFNRKVETSLNELVDNKMSKLYAKMNMTDVSLGTNEIILKGEAKK